MDFAAGSGADTSKDGWWAGESALSPSNNPTEECREVLPDLAPEYFILAGVASNMRSGFLLLNSSEQVTYSNPSAKRLLKLDSHTILTQPVFDVRQQLVSLAANPETAGDFRQLSPDLAVAPRSPARGGGAAGGRRRSR